MYTLTLDFYTLRHWPFLSQSSQWFHSTAAPWGLGGWRHLGTCCSEAWGAAAHLTTVNNNKVPLSTTRYHCQQQQDTTVNNNKVPLSTIRYHCQQQEDTTVNNKVPLSTTTQYPCAYKVPLSTTTRYHCQQGTTVNNNRVPLSTTTRYHCQQQGTTVNNKIPLPTRYHCQQQEDTTVNKVLLSTTTGYYCQQQGTTVNNNRVLLSTTRSVTWWGQWSTWPLSTTARSVIGVGVLSLLDSVALAQSCSST